MDSTKTWVEESFRSYESTASAMFEAADNGTEYEDGDASDAIAEWPLSIETKVMVDIDLTLGGPNVYIRCECSKSSYGTLDLDSATFHAAWGSDTRETRLSSSDALYRLAEWHIEGMEA